MRVLRVLGDPRVAAAITNLAEAIDAHAAGEEEAPRPPVAPAVALTVKADSPAIAPAEPLAITPEHRRAVERRLRKAGVLR